MSSADDTPLPPDRIEARLDEILEVEFNFRDAGPAAAAIARLTREEQQYVLDWVRRIASTHIELAYRFAGHAAYALEVLAPRGIEAWAVRAMDLYDRQGLHPALAAIHEIDSFVHVTHERAAGALFEEQQGVLGHFLHGLSGRHLKLEEADAPYTDSETLFLPPIVARLPDARDNFRLYKAMVALHWAQTRFGTFRLPLATLVEQHPDGDRLLTLFHALETERLEGCIGRELPGLYREMGEVEAKLADTAPSDEWEALAGRLRSADATAEDCLAIALDRVGELAPPPPRSYQGRLDPPLVQAVQAARIEREKIHFRVALARMLEEQTRETPGPERETRFDKRIVPDPTVPEGVRFELLLDDAPLAPPDEVTRLATSILLDLDDIPDEYLHPAGPGDYDPRYFKEVQEEEDPDAVWRGTYHEEGATLEREWDHRRQHYRKGWCAVRERDVEAVRDDFAEETLRKHAGLARHLRRTFEALRDEERILKRQPDGEGVDIDAVVEALADHRAGREMPERLFTRLHRAERNIAVAFMVDMSGSTRGWINDAERESLILLCEALEALGDRYAIYGFSGNTRKRCDLYRVKRFDEPYDATVRARISGIRPQDYTRMGFAIRHLSRLLNEQSARTRVLITLSDGKPDDYDGYRGEYGVEDTRRALLEAKRDGIHPYCITIDEEARDYLPHLYGPAAFTVVDEVRQLPFKVSDIYRRLTT
ncbi:VWA domain-containing protein [Endothiovibrio diazotrophicus]